MQTTDRITHIPSDKLFPSQTNPRKNFDRSKLQELANSILAQGLLQPLLVRRQSLPPPLAAEFNPALAGSGEEETHYEIASGERRYRAAQIAGLTELPCFIRDLTDTQVLHAQVIENIQRDALHPLEEAAGFKSLLGKRDEHGDLYTAESIGKATGKSKSYVYASLKLLALCDSGRAAFFKGRLDQSTALLIARIPTNKLQEEAVKIIGTPDSEGRDMSYRSAKYNIENRFQTDLTKAPFDPASTTLTDAGTCTDCPKRTGNDPETYADIDNPNICTDTACFQLKKTSAQLQKIQQAQQEHHIIISSDDAKELMSYPEYNDCITSRDLVRLTEYCPRDPEHRPWEIVLAEPLERRDENGKPLIQKTVIVNPVSGNPVECINKEVADAEFNKLGIVEITKPGRARDPESVRLQEEREVELERQTTYNQHLFDEIHNAIAAKFGKNKLPISFLHPIQILAETAYHQFKLRSPEDFAAKIIRPYCYNRDNLVDDAEVIEDMDSNFAELTPSELLLLMIDMENSKELITGYYVKTPKRMLEIAEELGLTIADGGLGSAE